MITDPPLPSRYHYTGQTEHFENAECYKGLITSRSNGLSSRIPDLILMHSLLEPAPHLAYLISNYQDIRLIRSRQRARISYHSQLNGDR